MTKQFTHLHLHTQYSLLDGAIRVKDLPKRIKELGMDSVAMTDHGNLFGAIHFYKECQKYNIKPILGCEIYVAHQSRFMGRVDLTKKDKSLKYPKYEKEQQKLTPGTGKAIPSKRFNYHLTAIAINQTGYLNLIKMVTRAYQEGFYFVPRVDWEVLREHSEGIVILSGCLSSELARASVFQDFDEINRILDFYKSTFGNRYYLETQVGTELERKHVQPILKRLSKEWDIPLVATNDCHFLLKEDDFHHSVLLGMQYHIGVNDPKFKEMREEIYDDLYLKTRDQMLKLHDEEHCNRTQDIVDQVDWNPLSKKFYMPRAPVDGDEFEALEKKTWDGLTARFPGSEVPKAYKDRITYELKVINDMGYPGYFLIVADIIDWCRDNDIPVGPGRGSVAGCLSAWALGISKIDSIKYGLLFERFLNPGRKGLPDIDTDICQRSRERVLEYIREKYGKDKVAQICTFDTIGVRGGIRDIGRVLGIPKYTCDVMAEAVPPPLHGVQPNLKRTRAETPQLEDTQDGKEIFKTLERLESISQNVSVHPAGVIISDTPLINSVPLCYDKGRKKLITQYDMNGCEAIGLVKFDFLGIRNLTVIKDTLEMVNAREDVTEKIDIDTLNLEDEDVYNDICTGNTAGVFQFQGSPGFRELVLQIQPKCMEDLAVATSLFRPGPLEAGYTKAYIKRRSGQEEVSYEIADLEPILKATHGTIVYQEQVMKIAQALCGYSLAEADDLRKAMGKKIKEKMDAERTKFISGGVKNGYVESDIEKLFNNISEFASYAFNKSHALAYSFVSYYTAYLKHYFPEEFFCSCLNSVQTESDSLDKSASYIHSMRDLGIEILPPSISTSGDQFSVDKKSIRFGISGIKNIGEKVFKCIISEREKNGPFSSFESFLRRVNRSKVNKTAVNNLIYSGAFDEFGFSRNALHSYYKNIVKWLDREKVVKDRKLELTVLAKKGEVTRKKQLPLPEKTELIALPEWGRGKLAAFEKMVMGIYISAHPLDHFRGRLEKIREQTIQEILAFRGTRRGKIIGVIITKDVWAVKKADSKHLGKPMAKLTVEDQSGSISCTVFPSTYEKIGGQLEEGDCVVLEGSIKSTETKFEFFVNESTLLENAVAQLTGVYVQAKTSHDIRKIKRLAEESGGHHPLVVDFNGWRIRSTYRVTNDLSERI